MRKIITAIISACAAVSAICISSITAAAQYDLPESYSSVDLGYITSVKNQGSWGDCWAFASTAASESSIIKEHGLNSATFDISENLMAYFITHPTEYGYLGQSADKFTFIGSDKSSYLSGGGNCAAAAMLLMSWAGPYAENPEYPYSLNSSPSIASKNFSQSEYLTLRNSGIAKLTDFYLVDHDLENSIELVKQLVYDFGAAATSYYENNDYAIKASDGSYYYYYNGNYNGDVDPDTNEVWHSNHAITVVGWDDNIPASRFKNACGTPKGDGAWLIKNSWGDGLRDHGYFWLSYYDASIDTTVAFDYALSSDDDYYDNKYEYDSSPRLSWLVSSGDTMYGANVFTVENDSEILKAASFYTDTPNSYHEIKAYLLNGSSGRLISQKDITVDTAGYFTVELDGQLLHKGDKFVIVHKEYIKNGNAKMHFEGSEGSLVEGVAVNVKPAINSGESYYSVNGRTWTDMSDRSGNIRIRAYTCDAGSDIDPDPQPIEITSDMVSQIPDTVYSFTAQTPAAAVTYLGKGLVSGLDYEITYKNNIEAGTASYTVKGIGSFCGSVTKTFKINKLDISSAIIYYDEQRIPYTGKTITPSITLMLPDGTLLTQNKHYKAEYENNLYVTYKHCPSTFTKITAIGSCTGSIVKENGFIIVPNMPVGHTCTFVEKDRTEPTCTAEGRINYICYTCGTEQYSVLPAKGHSYTAKVIASTYAAEGYTEHTCSVCGYSYKDTYTAKKVLSLVSGLYLKGRAADALRLAWNTNTSADGYIIEQKDGAKWVRIAKLTKNTTTEYRISKLKAGTAYSFRIRAYKMDGKTALYSGYTTISARTNPSAVSGLKLKGRAADALRLSWTKNTSADGYIIEQKDGAKWVRIAKLTKNTTTEYRISKLKAGTAYTFRIRAYKMSGKTALYSGYKSISERTDPSAVSGLKLKASATNAVRLSWTKNTSADGYIIEMKSGNSWTRVGKITKNSTVELRKSGLKSKTSYTFRVKTYKMSGKTALYGAAKTITVKTK